MTGPADLFSGVGTFYPAKFRISRWHVVLSTVAANLLALALPVMTLQIYDRILPNPESGTLPVLIVGVTVAIALEAVLKMARAYMIGWNGAAYEYEASSAAMNHLLNTDASKMRGYEAGEHLHRMAAIGKMKDFHSGYSLSVIIDMLFILVYAGFIVYVAGLLAVAPIALLVAFAFVSLAEGISLRHKMKDREKTDDKRYNFLIESLNKIHAVKAFALENILCRRYESLQEKSVDANYGVAEATASIFNTGIIMAHVMAAVTITVGVPFALDGQVTTGALIATLLLAGRMMQVVQRGLVLWVRYQDYLIARERVANIFSIPLVKYAGEIPPKEAEGRLFIRNLVFGFQGKDQALMKGLDLNMGPGDVVTLSGDFASGRTSLLNLIAGVYPLQQGEIMIDGADIRHYRPESLARHVGYITSDPIIFRGTIRDNITRFGEIGEKNARRIASLLGVDKDVARLPAGFDTVLYGNNNDAVPPGLKQRIAMTRVLAAGPRIILFDEADRSLDREGHKLVIRLLADLSRSCAIILITKDPDFCALATRHYLLENGTLRNMQQQEQGAR